MTDRELTPNERSAIALESIAKSLARVVTLLEQNRPPEVASDHELDSAHGNPTVKFDPRDWKGPVFAGKCMSQASPEYLDALAHSLEWAANNPKPGREKYVDYNRRDAARARGWAKRLRAGWTPPAKSNGISASAGTPPPAVASPSFGAPPPAAAPPKWSPPPGAGDAWEPPVEEKPAVPAINWDED